MAKIERKTQKIFAGNAATDELAVFGSMITGTPVYNDDIEALQSEAYTEGWKAAVAANEAPFMEEMNAVQYGFSKQLAYLFQQGIPEWDAGTTYYLNSFCQVGGVIYKSKLDENINHSPGDDTEEIYWTPFKAGDGGNGGLEVCDIGMSLYIDETKGLRRWLNGQIVAINQNTQGFLTRLKKIVALYPSLLTTEENWQAAKTLSVFGQVGKFVFNYAEDEETVESVRLPAVVNVQGLLDLQNLGMTVEAGLPNIEGMVYYGHGYLANATGAFYRGVPRELPRTTDGKVEKDYELLFDTSRSNPIYGATDTVQEETIQYPYYIQIATGQETEVNITNEIELNNPFFFGMSQYFDVEPNNLSWLKSDGMYKPKSVYPDYYNWILENVNKGVEGFKGQEGYCFIATDSSGYYWWVSTESPVVGASVYRYEAGVNSMFFDGTVETLTSNGFTFTSIFEGSSYTVTRDSSKDTSILHPTAWITDYDFVINTSDETFKLPLKNGTEGKFASRAKGNNMTLGLTNGSANGGLRSFNADGGNLQGLRVYSGSYGAATGVVSGGTLISSGNVNIGITTDPNKSGIVLDLTVPDGWALYYYVGETVQNANLIDAGRIEEQLATKTDMLQASGAGMPSDRYIDLTLGASGATYTAPANGYYFLDKSGANGTYVSLVNFGITDTYKYATTIPIYNTNGVVLLPVKKNDKVIVYYSATGVLNRFVFIYAQGAQ